MQKFNELWPGGPVFAQAEHFRLSTDSVLLADFVKTGGSERGIDIGCASGAIGVILLEKYKKIRLDGIELVPEAAALARENMEANGFSGRGEITAGDVREYKALLQHGAYDFIVCNPPYFPVSSGALSPDTERAGARSETSLTLEELCLASAFLLKTGGSLFTVGKPERMSQVLCSLSASGIEPKRLRLVSSDISRAPSLFLLEGKRGGKPGLVIEAPLYLNLNGEESPEYKRIYHR